MLRAAFALCSLAALTPAQSPPDFRWAATEHLGCLSPPATLQPLGLAGTDLGVSFPVGDELVFLFGDSWTLDRKDWDVDSFAHAPLRLPTADRLPQLRWATQQSGRFASLAPKGLQLGGMNVPVEGIAIDGRVVVFFSDGWNARAGRHSHSVCAVATDKDLTDLHLQHRVATDKFVNVSCVRDGDDVWIFASGSYRKSSVFLARAPGRQLDDRSAWRYWPEFGAVEATAQPLVTSDCVGELSVRRLPGSELWWMTYNAALPRGIHLRWAAAPTGPWSDPIVLFDPSRDRGYGHTMHQRNAAVGHDDGLSEPGREEEWGGEYGPYLVPEWSDASAHDVVHLVYVLSTWNPYTVRLLRSTVVQHGKDWKVATPLPKAGKGPRNLAFAGGKLDGWQQQGDAFATVARDDGTHFVCTYVAPRGDAVQGRLWQEFTVPPEAKELRGVVFGGSEAVQLWCGDELVRSTRGRRSNEVDVPFRWRLDALRGKTVRLQIVDGSTGRWGFVSVRGLQLVP